MQIGFAKNDITPRVGVELCGFGPFLNRHSIGGARSAVGPGHGRGTGRPTLIVVSCDLVGVLPAHDRTACAPS